jgi:hypothetical protein
VPRAVTIREIERIFAVTDPLGIHREAVVIPLAMRSPGGVRRLPGGRIEIVVDAVADFEQWVAGLPARIASVG